MNFLVVAAAIALSSVLGVVIGLCLKTISHRTSDVVLSLAAGMMLAAASFGLLQSAVNLHPQHPYAILLAALGTFAGAAVICLIDRFTPHLHRLAGIDQEVHRNNSPASNKVLLFVAAIAIHKFPEGMAAGVSISAGEPYAALTVISSISLQNIPEAVVTVSPLLAIGVSIPRTLVIAVAIGAVSVAGAAFGAAISSITDFLIPFLLAFAGGAMIYVVSDEMIPETHSHGFEKQSSFAMLAGFVAIMIFNKLV
jgi:ZIP family zinc transporter